MLFIYGLRGLLFFPDKKREGGRLLSVGYVMHEESQNYPEYSSYKYFNRLMTEHFLDLFTFFEFFFGPPSSGLFDKPLEIIHENIEHNRLFPGLPTDAGRIEHDDDGEYRRYGKYSGIKPLLYSDACSQSSDSG